ncbi:uncharacterized protein LOC143083567 [Mytilus galloprovincialis]|uniref:uncharacterized protein LOC143083567 n=1 Tax=Mytilus galloprovincialis TaxID=29158 RepID=UPI003F7C08A1
MAVHYLLFLSVLFNTGYQCSSLEVELGNKNYTINFITYTGKNGDKVEILCQRKQVGGVNITWYFIHSYNHDNYQPELYPFSFCQKEKNCELDNGGRLLIVKQFDPSAGGSYICVDGENGQGYSVHFQECVPPIVKQLSFYNQTASIGTNVTFSCRADTGEPNCTTDVDFISFRFPGGERYKKSKLSKRIVDGRVIVSKNLTLLNIRKEDFGINVNCTMFAETGPLQLLSAWLLEQDSSTIEDTKVDIKIVLFILLPVCIVIFIKVVIFYLYHPRISYVRCHLTHNLPKRGGKPFHGMILYNEDAKVYDKVQKLKSGLHGYNLREYPPGPDSIDQQAGYSLPTFLDTMCQECACVIVVGEIGDLEERCVSSFKGKEVTHIILSGSQDKKKINPVIWPKETSCNGNRKWTNFIFEVKKGLPKLGRRVSSDPEEQMLTNV